MWHYAPTLVTCDTAGSGDSVPYMVSPNQASVTNPRLSQRCGTKRTLTAHAHLRVVVVGGTACHSQHICTFPPKPNPVSLITSLFDSVTAIPSQKVQFSL